MRTSALALAAILTASPTFAQLPDFYRTVTSVHWVVNDLNAVKEGWAKLGFPVVQDFGEVALNVTHRGRTGSANVRVAITRFGGLEVVWLQPLNDVGAFAEFLSKNGSGIMSLNHRTTSLEALRAEVSRLQGVGVAVLQSCDVDTDSGLLSVVHMDTEPDGKYVLGLVHGSVPSAGSPPSSPSHGLALSQFAFLAKDLKATSDFWKRLGFPEITVSYGPIHDRVYRGQPGQFEQELGWQRHGEIVYEWIRILESPTVYDEFLKSHGEGVHHLGFNASDIDELASEWDPRGFVVAQSGRWGEKGKPGSGRFAYVDTDSIGGVLVELLWNQR
jgi:catechol 2,3-dioxygenase-like lactoylglutathione lyase family enzyme